MTDLVARIADALAGETALVSAWVFGSVARGTARGSSDIDLAVVATVRTGVARTEWVWGLEARLALALRRTVDVVDFERAPADLAHRVLRDGQLLVDRDRARRIALEVRKRNEYFDMTPTWRRIRRLPPGVAP